MPKIFYGYMRVSSADQNDERQKQELLRWGIVEKNLYADKLSGKDFNRPSYQRLRRRLCEGDVLVVKSIDRLGRNYEEVQNEWRYIVKEKRADIVILDMPILDTRTNKDLIGTLISDIVLQLLSYVAQTERDFIRQRQAEGIAIARANGIHLGRPAKEPPEGFQEGLSLWRSKKLTFQAFATRLNITETQLKWLIRRQNMKEREGN